MTDTQGQKGITVTDGVPADTFAVRLGIIRTVMGWNLDQAGEAAGVSSEAWRTWETGKHRCTDVIGVSQRIGAATGISWQWIALGGPLAPAA